MSARSSIGIYDKAVELSVFANYYSDLNSDDVSTSTSEVSDEDVEPRGLEAYYFEEGRYEDLSSDDISTLSSQLSDTATEAIAYFEETITLQDEPIANLQHENEVLRSALHNKMSVDTCDVPRSVLGDENAVEECHELGVLPMEDSGDAALLVLERGQKDGHIGMALAHAVDRIANLEGRLSRGKSTISSLRNEVVDLQARVLCLERELDAADAHSPIPRTLAATRGRARSNSISHGSPSQDFAIRHGRAALYSPLPGTTSPVEEVTDVHPLVDVPMIVVTPPASSLPTRAPPPPPSRRARSLALSSHPPISDDMPTYSIATVRQRMSADSLRDLSLLRSVTVEEEAKMADLTPAERERVKQERKFVKFVSWSDDKHAHGGSAGCMKLKKWTGGSGGS